MIALLSVPLHLDAGMPSSWSLGLVHWHSRELRTVCQVTFKVPVPGPIGPDKAKSAACGAGIVFCSAGPALL